MRATITRSTTTYFELLISGFPAALLCCAIYLISAIPLLIIRDQWLSVPAAVSLNSLFNSGGMELKMEMGPTGPLVLPQGGFSIQSLATWAAFLSPIVLIPATMRYFQFIFGEGLPRPFELIWPSGAFAKYAIAGAVYLIFLLATVGLYYSWKNPQVIDLMASIPPGNTGDWWLATIVSLAFEFPAFVLMVGLAIPLIGLVHTGNLPPLGRSLWLFVLSLPAILWMFVIYNAILGASQYLMSQWRTVLFGHEMPLGLGWPHAGLLLGYAVQQILFITLLSNVVLVLYEAFHASEDA